MGNRVAETASMEMDRDELRRLEALRLASATQHSATPAEVKERAKAYHEFLKGE